MVVFPIERHSQRTVLTVAIVFTVLAVIACGLRVLARRVSRRTLDSSDWCVLAACLVTVVYQSINISSVFRCGVGFHIEEIIEAHGMAPVTLFLKFLIAIQLLWALSLSLCKISVLIMYTKIFSMTAFVWAARVTAVFIVMWAVTTTLMGFFMCRPFAFNWDPTLPGGHCGNQVLSYQITGAMNLATDLVVLVLPIKYLASLNLALYKKIVLICSFTVGIFTCVVSVLRLVALSSIDYSDITFNVSESLIFSGLEPCLAVTLACVPVLRPLLGVLGGSSAASAGNSRQTNSKMSKFRKLNENSSEVQLRPLGTKHTAEASRAQHSSGSGLSSDGDAGADSTGKGVLVKQEWKVTAAEE